MVASRGEQGEEAKTGMTFVATENATSMAAVFRRINDDADPPRRILVVYDRRLPLKLGSAGQEYRGALKRRGREHYREIALSFRDYAELDAWQKVIGDASAGDLEVDLAGGRTRRVTEEEAAALLHRQGRFRQHRLFRLF
jgi:hypothetical protein